MGRGHLHPFSHSSLLRRLDPSLPVCFLRWILGCLKKHWCYQGVVFRLFRVRQRWTMTLWRKVYIVFVQTYLISSSSSMLSCRTSSISFSRASILRVACLIWSPNCFSESWSSCFPVLVSSFCSASSSMFRFFAYSFTYTKLRTIRSLAALHF